MYKPNKENTKCELDTNAHGFIVPGFYILICYYAYLIICLLNNTIIRYKELDGRRFRDKDGNIMHFEMIPYFEPIMMIQTIIFIPHMNVLMSNATISYFRDLRHLLFSFSFIPNGLQDFGEDRDNTYLYLIGIQSNDSWINMFYVFAILCFLIIVLIVSILLKLFI